MKFKKNIFQHFNSITKGSAKTPHYLNKIIQLKYYSLFIYCQHVRDRRVSQQPWAHPRTSGVCFPDGGRVRVTHTVSGWGYRSKSFSFSVSHCSFLDWGLDPHPELTIYLLCHGESIHNNNLLLIQGHMNTLIKSKYNLYR